MPFYDAPRPSGPSADCRDDATTYGFRICRRQSCCTWSKGPRHAFRQRARQARSGKSKVRAYIATPRPNGATHCPNIVPDVFCTPPTHHIIKMQTLARQPLRSRNVRVLCSSTSRAPRSRPRPRQSLEPHGRGQNRRTFLPSTATHWLMIWKKKFGDITIRKY